MVEDAEKYQQIQMLEYQVKQLQKVLENIETQMNEINITIDSLRGFSELKSGDEILFPLANGIFSKGTLSDEKILRINVGSNAVVEKSVTDAIAMMEKQAKDMENYKMDVLSQLQNFIDALNRVQA